jgi:short-subunit dehydrogenase
MTPDQASNGRRALVTGASSGIGAAFARRLGADGFDLMVVARRGERLEALAEELRRDAGIEVEVMPVDLTDPDQLADLEARIVADGSLELLVNNAGFGGYMPFIELDPDQAEALVRVHVLAMTRLTRAALPGMVERGRGAIINVASLLAFTGSIPPRPLPHRATYAAAKAYMVTFTQALSNELHGAGVQPQVLCPGLVKTEFHQVAGFDRAQLPFPPMEPEEVVDASFAGLELGEVICMPGLRDTELLEHALSQQRAIFQAASPGPLADRYTAQH